MNDFIKGILYGGSIVVVSLFGAFFLGNALPTPHHKTPTPVTHFIVEAPKSYAVKTKKVDDTDFVTFYKATGKEKGDIVFYIHTS